MAQKEIAGFISNQCSYSGPLSGAALFFSWDSQSYTFSSDTVTYLLNYVNDRHLEFLVFHCLDAGIVYYHQEATIAHSVAKSVRTSKMV